jgi:hypothetical protein
LLTVSGRQNSASAYPRHDTHLKSDFFCRHTYASSRPTRAGVLDSGCTPQSRRVALRHYCHTTTRILSPMCRTCFVHPSTLLIVLVVDRVAWTVTESAVPSLPASTTATTAPRHRFHSTANGAKKKEPVKKAEPASTKAKLTKAKSTVRAPPNWAAIHAKEDAARAKVPTSPDFSAHRSHPFVSCVFDVGA